MQVNPIEEDWKEVKRIFRYLKGTSDLGLTYRAKDENLTAMTDANFRDCSDASFTGGYGIKLFGDRIMWRACMSLNNVETMSDACQELVSLDKAIRDIIGNTMYPVTIWCDNKSAIDCTKMDGSHKLKHFDDDLETIRRNLENSEKSGTKSHMAVTHGDYIKSCVIEGKVTVGWVSTKENEADIMTKPVPFDTHTYLTDKIINSE